ncbi:AAA family ATPase [Rhizobium sp.]|uniref:AAA family ATPase n=1 Tax=Rhizobium sp. TaxID=391 RepID=UPI0028A23340
MSNKLPPIRRPQDAALYCTLLRALRNAPAFKDGQRCVVLLNVGNAQTAEDYDVSAANIVLRQSSDRDDIGYWMIANADTPRAIAKKFERDLGKARRTLIFREVGAEIPMQAMLGVDVEIDIPPISATDFRIACRTAYQIDVSAAEAEALMTYPLGQTWAALRQGQPAKDALIRLSKFASVDVRQSNSRGDLPLLQDMFGYGPAKSWGLELARDLEDWKKGEINWSDVDTGIVLSGPPGVGKTQFAGALARQCDIPLIATSLGRWQSHGHLGDLLKAMRADFNKAKEQVPCILFCDELDSFGDRNSFSHDNKDYSVQVVNSFLEQLDGIEGREGVVVIGATNNFTRIDSAIVRPGRLDLHVAIPLPDATDRVAILDQLIGKPSHKKHLPEIITATSGFSGADLAKVVRDARRKARRMNKEVDYDDLISSLPDLVPVIGQLRRSLAVHEAGHVVAVVSLGHGKFHSAMIMEHTRLDGPSSPGGGAYYELEKVAYRTAQTYRNQILVSLAGIAAEEVILGAVADGAGVGEGSDLAQATRIATVLQTTLGMGDRLRHSLASSYTELERLRIQNPAVGKWVDEVLAAEFSRAKQLIREHKSLVLQIADELEAKGKITAAQVTAILKGDDVSTHIETAA